MGDKIFKRSWKLGSTVFAGEVQFLLLRFHPYGDPWLKHYQSLTHSFMPMNAVKHVGQQQSITTPVCSRPVSEWFPRCAVGSWAPLAQSHARCSWVVPACVFLLVSNVGLCGWCCFYPMENLKWNTITNLKCSGENIFKPCFKIVEPLCG